MKETRAFLASIGMPEGDLYSLPTSKKRFEDGGQYRFEVPGIQAPGAMKALLEALESLLSVLVLLRIRPLPSIRKKVSAWDTV